MQMRFINFKHSNNKQTMSKETLSVRNTQETTAKGGCDDKTS